MTTSAHAAYYNGLTDYTVVPCTGVTNDSSWTIQVNVTNLATDAPQGRAAYVEGVNSSSTSYVYIGMGPNGAPECSVRTGSTQVFARGSAVMDLNTPQVIACTSNGMSLDMYLNGLLRAQVPLTGTTPATRDRCTVGALNRPSGVTCFWHGELANLRVWDRTLTAQEVFVESGIGPQPPDPTVEPAHGHTLLVWTPPTPTYGMEATQFFQVQRQVYLPTSSSSWQDVWNTAACNRPAYTDEDGVSYPAYICDYFPLLRAPNIPREGVEYEYRVRTVGVQGNVSVWSAAYWMEPQDPTKCYAGGHEIPCI